MVANSLSTRFSGWTLQIALKQQWQSHYSLWHHTCLPILPWLFSCRPSAESKSSPSSCPPGRWSIAFTYLGWTNLQHFLFVTIRRFGLCCFGSLSAVAMYFLLTSLKPEVTRKKKILEQRAAICLPGKGRTRSRACLSRASYGSPAQVYVSVIPKDLLKQSRTRRCIYPMSSHIFDALACWTLVINLLTALAELEK